jgi:hypothetical protein
MEADNASVRKASKAGQAKNAAKTASKPKASSQGKDADRPQLISDIAAKIISKAERQSKVPVEYTEELADEFCKRIALGRSLRSVCEDEDMPDASTVFLWKRTKSGFVERYARATEERGLTYGDRISDLIDAVLLGDYEVDRARLALDGLKWTAARLAPKQYGDKQQVEVTADLGATAARVLMDLTQQARDAKAIEHNVIDVTPTLIGERSSKDNNEIE